MFWSPTAVLAMTTLVLMTLVDEGQGHGYMIRPPGRSSMWRRGFHVPRNYNDNGLRCGGSRTQCGVCGDPADGPRDNEAGGKYATGLIAEEYVEGQPITVRVVITANHEGWFEFHLCPNNNVSRAATEECLMSHVLRRTNGETRYPLRADQYADIDISLLLPEGVTCTQCVLRWKWITELSNKEQFYSCSDVMIRPRSGVFPITSAPENLKPATLRPETPRPETPRPETPRPETPRPETPKPEIPRPETPIPETPAPETTAPATTRHTPKTPSPEYTESPATGKPHRLIHGHAPYLRCRPLGVWQNNQEMADWCHNNCNNPDPHCPPSLCACRPRK